MLTAEEVRRVIEYNPETGSFTRKVGSGGRAAGSSAGSLNSVGYVQVGVLGKNCLGHRLAWLIAHGEWPVGQVDHVNRNRADNRLANLRVVSPKENKQNCGPRSSSKSGIKGVHYCRRTMRWVSQIAANGQSHFLGRFATAEEAASAYADAAARLHRYNPAAFGAAQE